MQAKITSRIRGCGCIAALFLAAATPAAAAADSVIQAEYAFAHAVAEHGIREGFLAYMDAQAVVLAPLPVRGPAYYRARVRRSTRLSWYPVAALESAAGDFGYTTGPWTARPLESRNVYHGEYLTVWHRDGSGDWRVLLDAGVAHAAPPVSPPALNERARVPQLSPRHQPADTAALQLVLRELDWRYTALGVEKGMRALYARLAAGNIRLLQTGSLPVAGRAAVLAAVPAVKARLRWVPGGSFVSASGDLGCTYGVAYRIGDDLAHAVPQSSYVHLWQKENGAWRLVVDLELAVPPMHSP